MFCQVCGERIEDPAKRDCPVCGRKNASKDLGFVWPSLLLLAILALVILATYFSLMPVGFTGVAPIDRNRLSQSPEMLSADHGTNGDATIDEPANPATSSQIALPDSYELPVSFSEIGRKLIAAGAIDYHRFVQIYEQAGQALSKKQLVILSHGSDLPIVITQENAHFLLNFLWALGLSNQNPILDTGPLVEYSEGDIGRFASTGGWTLGQRPSTELYSSTTIISLTPEQQRRLENVAYNVYRPCCDNHTAFADCNHGMAMLGLLELLASEGASEDKMFEAAKYVNGFWFPQHTKEMAVFFKVTMNLDYDEVYSRMAVGPEVFSGTGFRTLHNWLASNGQLELAPNSGGNCSV